MAGELSGEHRVLLFFILKESKGAPTSAGDSIVSHTNSQGIASSTPAYLAKEISLSSWRRVRLAVRGFGIHNIHNNNDKDEMALPAPWCHEGQKRKACHGGEEWENSDDDALGFLWNDTAPNESINPRISWRCLPIKKQIDLRMIRIWKVSKITTTSCF